MSGGETDAQAELVKGIFSLPPHWVAWVLLIGLAIYMGPSYLKAINEIIGRWRLDSIRIKASQQRLMQKLAAKHKAKEQTAIRAKPKTPALEPPQRGVAERSGRLKVKPKRGAD